MTPELALGYLRELSCDGLTGSVLDRRGGWVAGGALPAEAAGVLAAALPDGGRLRADGGDARLFAAASPGHLVLVATGPLSLPGLVFHDLGDVLAGLAGVAESLALDAPALVLDLAGDAVRAPADGSDAALRRACAALLAVLAARA